MTQQMIPRRLEYLKPFFAFDKKKKKSCRHFISIIIIHEKKLSIQFKTASGESYGMFSSQPDQRDFALGYFNNQWILQISN